MALTVRDQLARVRMCLAEAGYADYAQPTTAGIGPTGFVTFGTHVALIDVWRACSLTLDTANGGKQLCYRHFVATHPARNFGSQAEVAAHQRAVVAAMDACTADRPCVQDCGSSGEM